MIEFRKATITEVIGIVIGVVGIVGITFFRDGIVNILGGLTEEQAAKKYSLVSEVPSPNYKFQFFHGLSIERCQRAIFETVSAFDKDAEVAPTERRRYGLYFKTNSSAGQQIAGNATCFSFKLTDHSKDVLTLLMVAGVGDLDRSATFASLDLIFESIAESLNEEDYFKKGLPSPFERKLSKAGNFIVKTQYAGKDIEVSGLEDFVAIGPISEITLEGAVKGYWCSMYAQGISEKFESLFPDERLPDSEQECEEHFN